MPEYIERETLVSMLYAKADMAYGTPKMVFCAASKIVELLPAADVAPVVHGKWRFCGSDRWNDTYECSECGKMAMDDSKYCPNCGAKMDGGEHD